MTLQAYSLIQISSSRWTRNSETPSDIWSACCRRLIRTELYIWVGRICHAAIRTLRIIVCCPDSDFSKLKCPNAAEEKLSLATANLVGFVPRKFVRERYSLRPPTQSFTVNTRFPTCTGLSQLHSLRIHLVKMAVLSPPKVFFPLRTVAL